LAKIDRDDVAWIPRFLKNFDLDDSSNAHLNLQKCIPIQWCFHGSKLVRNLAKGAFVNLAHGE